MDAPAARAVRCVSSGYMTHGCSCEASVPAAVVEAAWLREQRLGPDGNRLFEFAWGEEIWLAYGSRRDGVRGVYCPRHNAERTERSFMQLLARSAPATIAC